MGYPYGLGLASFLDQYNRAEALDLQRRRGELQEALSVLKFGALERERLEGERVDEELAQALATRRGLPPLTPDIGLQIQSGAPIPGAEMALEAGTVQPGVTNLALPTSTAGFFPPPTSRPPFAASLSARTLGHPRAQRVIQSVEESGKEEERQRNVEEARQLSTVATERFRQKDGAGGYEELAKAYDRRGQYDVGFKARQHAITLRQDKEEAGLFEEDLTGWLAAQKAFQGDPSTKTHADFLDALTAAKSKTGRAFRGQLLGNQIKAALGKDPFSAIFFKKLNEKYSAAWATGEKPDFDTMVKQLDREQPGLLLRVLGNELEANKEVHKAIFTRLLGIGEDVDPKTLKDTGAQAVQAFRQQYGRPPRTEDDFAEVGKIQGRLKEAARSPEQKELDTLRLDKERFERDVRGGKIEPNINQLTLFRQRATASATKADEAGDTELAESLRQEERYWSQRIAEQIKKQPAGKELGKPKAGTGAAILGGRKFEALAEEEKRGVLLAEAKRLFPAKVKTFDDLKNLSRPERERLKAEIAAVEGRGGRQP